MSARNEIQKAVFRDVTQARLTLGPRGRALDTKSALRFSLDHAQARAAVLSELDIPALETQLNTSGLKSACVTSAAQNRNTYIRRPDLGRKLSPDYAGALTGCAEVDVAIVLGDGLSAIAVALNGPAFVSTLTKQLNAHNLSYGPIVLARQARVALGDQIAQAMSAKTVVMAIGERPGLSAADSLGVYVTHLPNETTQDSGRNCISNIREAGISVAEAAEQVTQLILDMRRSGLSGVALNQSRSAGLLAKD